MRLSSLGGVGALLLLVGACDGNDNDKQGGSALSAKVDREVAGKLRECELLSKGDLQGVAYFGPEEPSKVSSCRADCYLEAANRAGCDEVERFACEGTPSDRIRECLADCQALQLRCPGGGTYQANQRCNGRADCEDRADEEGCFFLTGICDDGETVSLDQSYLVTCDGERDCDDGSDEADCPAPVYCGNGDKVQPYQVCDGEKDCDDGADEKRCTGKPKYFHCKNGNGIFSSEVLCNLSADCSDGSDESIEQGCAQLTCALAGFECSEKRITNALVCDGKADCANGEDESFSLCADLFVCRSGERLTDAFAECNGSVECRDGSDEADCDFGDGDFGDGDVGDGDGDFGDGDGDGDVIIRQTCDEGATGYDVSQECDGIVDCVDISDELDCSSTPTLLRCNATTTVTLDAYCDGTVDCVTNARDEANCFTCPLSGAVIPLQFTCDGELDCCTSAGTCDDDSDELSCP